MKSNSVALRTRLIGLSLLLAMTTFFAHAEDQEGFN